MTNYIERDTSNAPRNRYSELEQMWEEIYGDAAYPGFSEDLYDSLYNVKTQNKLPEGYLSGVRNQGVVRPIAERYGSEPIPNTSPKQEQAIADRSQAREAYVNQSNNTGPDLSGGMNNFVTAKDITASQQNTNAQPVNTQIPMAPSPYDNPEFQPGVISGPNGPRVSPLPNTRDRRFSPQWENAMAETYKNSNPDTSIIKANDNPYDENSQRGTRYRQLSQQAYGAQDPAVQADIQNMNRARAAAGSLAQQKFSNRNDLYESGMTADQMLNWEKTRGIPTEEKPQYARLVGDFNDTTDYERAERSRMKLNTRPQPQPQQNVRSNTPTSNTPTSYKQYDSPTPQPNKQQFNQRNY